MNGGKSLQPVAVKGYIYYADEKIFVNIKLGNKNDVILFKWLKINAF